jgi:hypothetical protein
MTADMRTFEIPPLQFMYMIDESPVEEGGAQDIYDERSERVSEG